MYEKNSDVIEVLFLCGGSITFLPMSFQSLDAITLNSIIPPSRIEGIGMVQDQLNDELLINDDSPPAAAVCRNDLCRHPVPASQPELPSIALLVTTIISFPGALLIVMKSEEH